MRFKQCIPITFAHHNFHRQVQRHRHAAGPLEQELQFSMIISYIVPLQEEERIVPITYALEGFKQAFQVQCMQSFKGYEMNGKTQVTLNLNQDMISRIDELKAEWAIDSRALIIERIVEEVFEIQNA